MIGYGGGTHRFRQFWSLGPLSYRQESFKQRLIALTVLVPTPVALSMAPRREGRGPWTEVSNLQSVNVECGVTPGADYVSIHNAQPYGVFRENLVKYSFGGYIDEWLVSVKYGCCTASPYFTTAEVLLDGGGGCIIYSKIRSVNLAVTRGATTHSLPVSGLAVINRTVNARGFRPRTPPPLTMLGGPYYFRRLRGAASFSQSSRHRPAGGEADASATNAGQGWQRGVGVGPLFPSG
jgi:hypothetical protein